MNGKLVNREIKIENVTNRMFDDTNIYQFNSRFNFALIVENCNAVNYVSEKIYDAWVAGCIPIYFGNNSKGFLNSYAIFSVQIYFVSIAGKKYNLNKLDVNEK
jgi:hypothetical protein